MVILAVASQWQFSLLWVLIQKKICTQRYEIKNTKLWRASGASLLASKLVWLIESRSAAHLLKTFFLNVYSHLEWIQLFSVGGLLPLQTVCQLRADLSRRRSINTINHHCILYSYVLYEEYRKCWMSAPVCSPQWSPTTFWPPARPSPALSVTPPSAVRRGDTLRSCTAAIELWWLRGVINSHEKSYHGSFLLLPPLLLLCSVQSMSAL